MDISATNSASSNTSAQSRAIQAAQKLQEAQSGDAAAVSNDDQAEFQSQYSAAVLKKAVDIQSSQGTQLSQMIGRGSGVDFYA